MVIIYKQPKCLPALWLKLFKTNSLITFAFLYPEHEKHFKVCLGHYFSCFNIKIALLGIKPFYKFITLYVLFVSEFHILNMQFSSLHLIYNTISQCNLPNQSSLSSLVMKKKGFVALFSFRSNLSSIAPPPS